MERGETVQRLASLAQAVSLPVEEVIEVFRLLEQRRTFDSETLLGEMEWFYRELGLVSHYFRTTPLPLIARHIESLYAAKILSRTSGEPVNLRQESETNEMAIYAIREEHAFAVKIERRIGQKFPNHRLQSYHSVAATTPGDPESQLRLYFIAPPHFGPDEIDPTATDIEKVGSPLLLARAAKDTKRRYQQAIEQAMTTLGLVIEFHDREDTGTVQMILAHRRGGTHSYLAAVSDLLNYHGINSRRKYIEQFSNGIVLYSIHIAAPVSQQVLDQIREDLSLAYVLPHTAFTPLFERGLISAQQLGYAYVVWKFAHQFVFRYTREYRLLAPAFSHDPVRLGLLEQFKLRLNKDKFTEARIYDAIVTNLELVKDLYEDFASHHFTSPGHPTKAYDPRHAQDLERRINKDVSSPTERAILSTFLSFNRHVLKTNFYRDSKIALAFRLDPAVLPKSEYRARPFGIFFLLGSEFRGFHVRFRDVARGGIRIIRSANRQVFGRNNDFLFNEAYQLARTQQSKNKDIPEGGSKGALLLALEHQDKASGAFKKYVDALLDVLLPNEEIADHYGREEILFLGPDEGTADLADWASRRARERGYPFWRAFTTGKSIGRGGIPHDRYGMTTRSVHQYVLGILRELNIDQSSITKLQTGGPDGDLGSNEIKISRDRTIAVVDGSGVLYDPQGINREELGQLAEQRQMVCQFDRAKLGERGFMVRVEDRDVQLPDGTLVENGLIFRDEFHLNPLAAADLFVPCGGRPDSVHINNVARLFDDDGKPRFRFIVEGANLFFAQPARRALEKAGVVLFKDASANKGGVTSSSLEVLAALVLHDEQFQEHMEVRDGRTPQFYRRYIRDVHRKIEENAALEFGCIWREHARTGTGRSQLSDVVSTKINLMADRIERSHLVHDAQLRRRVLAEACPESLQELVGLETVLQRLPESYLRALVGAHLASRYVYRCGLGAGELDFVEFLAAYTADPASQPPTTA